MNDGDLRNDPLDDVALYALGVLPAGEAARVRAGIAAHPEYAQEYALLVSASSAVGISAVDEDRGGAGGALLKARIMRAVRSERRAPIAARPPVWPAYLVAAACFAIAIMSSLWNVALIGQLKQTQTELAQISQRSTSLAINLAGERSTLSDLLAIDAKHYASGQSEIVARGDRLYLAMRALPEPPRGKVYQAWTLAKGAKKMVPSPTFVPDAHGLAVIALPVDARTTAAVAVSVEPEGGSKQPTSKPVLLVPLT